MTPQPQLFRLYQDLQRYVGWTDRDIEHIQEAGRFVRPIIDDLVEDFYSEVERHAAAKGVITGGHAQVLRLKGTLRSWIAELFSGVYDEAYVMRRWRIGRRHLEIGLQQVFANVALVRMQNLMMVAICAGWDGDRHLLNDIVQSLNRLLHLDLAIIEDAYESAHAQRVQDAERKRGEDRFKSLVEAAGCMIVTLRADHSIVYFSPFAESLTGYKSEEVVGRDYFELFLPPYEREGVAAAIIDIFAGQEVTGYQNDVKCKDGSLRTMLWNARQVNNFDGEDVCLAVGQDITALKDAQEKALRSERLATIGQMITGLAHESRNALQRIQASTEVLELEVESNPTALDFVHRIQDAQSHIRQLYDEVRGYAAPIQLDRDTCSIHQVCREAWHLIESAKRQTGAILEMRFEPGDYRCHGDQFRLIQVFRNLFENALDAGEPPIVIEVACERVMLDAHAAVRITVADNGPGMSPEQRHHIFEPFFTTKPKGTGLGMAIAQRTIVAHGGSIAVADSKIGAMIVITLPE